MSFAKFTPSREAAKALNAPPQLAARFTLAIGRHYVSPLNATRRIRSNASQRTSNYGDELVKNFLGHQVRNLISKTERRSAAEPRDESEQAMYVIKPSPGKGLGVFASKTIQSGTTILCENPLMTIMKDFLDLEAKDVFAEFQKLKPSSQKDFLELQESHQKCESKLLSIWKANSFALEDNRGTAVWLTISRINHSCQPNARRELDSEGQTTKIIATKTIAQGEEIFILYSDETYGLTKAQRLHLLQWSWGFRCSCPACSLSGEEGKASDVRRAQIGTLITGLEGFEPVDWNEWKAKLDACQDETERLRAVRLDQKPLSRSLGNEDMIPLNVVLAQLLEAEGLLNVRVVTAYTTALNAIIQEIRTSPDVILIEHLYCAELCMKEILAMSAKLGASQEQMKYFEDSFNAVKSLEAMQAGTEFLRTTKNDSTEYAAIRLHRFEIDGKRATITFGVSDEDYLAAIDSGRTPGPSYEEASRQVSDKTIKSRLAAFMRGQAKSSTG